MPQLVLTPTTWQGVQSNSTTSFSQMRNGNNLNVNTSHQIGTSDVASPQQWIGNEDFLAFSLSSLPAAATVTAVKFEAEFSTLGLQTASDAFDVGIYNWGSSVTTADWTPNPGVSVAAAQVLNGISATGTWYSYALPGSVLLNGVIAAGTGTLKLIVISDAMAGGTDLGTGNRVFIASGYRLTITYSFPKPTVTSYSPSLSQIAGGGTLTVNGTGFQNNSPGTISVTVCGISATSVSVVSDTQLTCIIPTSGSAQSGNIVVTSANNGSSFQITTFTYVNVVDSHVRLVKGGTVTGNDYAITGTPWPLSATSQSYGSSNDLWGATLTPADVNASNFGVAFAANVTGSSGHAYFESVAVTVYYSVASNSQPGTYLLALVSDVGGDTVTPTIYKLPNSGFSPGLDNNIQHAVSGADFYTSRMHLPSRNLLKAYRCIEFWCDLAPSTNTPGLQVWAAVDNGAFSQLLDGNGNAAMITASGTQRLFFPVSTTGHFVQLDFKVPALTGGQVPVAVTIRDLDIRVSLRPVLTDAISATLVLGQGQFQDRTTQVTLEPDQLAYLQQQLDAGPVIAYRDPITGEAGQMLVTGLTWQPVVFPGENNPTLVAHLTARKMRYSNG